MEPYVVSYHEIPEGRPGYQLTLSAIARMIRAGVAEPPTREFLAALADSPLADEHPADLAARLFTWVKGRVLYTNDDPTVQDEIRTAGVMLHDIQLRGSTLGDCDDLISLLGALWHGCGHGVELVGVHPIGQSEWHVYMRMECDGEWVAADLVSAEPFGWEISDTDVSDMISVVV